GGAGIVGQLYDAIEHLSRNLVKLLGCNSCRSWYRPHQRIPIERIKLIEGDDRNNQAIAHLGWGQRSAHSDNEIDITRPRVRPQCFDEQTPIRRIAGDDEISFEPADGHHPAELLDQIAVLLEYLSQCLTVG